MAICPHCGNDVDPDDLDVFGWIEDNKLAIITTTIFIVGLVVFAIIYDILT